MNNFLVVTIQDEFGGITLEEYTKKRLDEHNADMCRLEILSDISFDNYKINAENMINELNEDLSSYNRKIDHFSVQRYVNKKESNAYGRFIRYMIKYKNMQKDQVLEILWKDRPQTIR